MEETPAKGFTVCQRWIEEQGEVIVWATYVIDAEGCIS